MTTNAAVYAPVGRALASPRLLGTLGMVASPMMAVEGLLLPSLPPSERDFWMGVCSLIYVLGWLCSAVGLRRLRATGDGAVARGVTYAQMTGLGLATLWA